MHSPAGVNGMTDEQDIRARKYGEVVYNTLTSVAATVLEYPKGNGTWTLTRCQVDLLISAFFPLSNPLQT